MRSYYMLTLLMTTPRIHAFCRLHKKLILLMRTARIQTIQKFRSKKSVQLIVNSDNS